MREVETSCFALVRESSTVIPFRETLVESFAMAGNWTFIYITSGHRVDNGSFESCTEQKVHK